MIERIEHLEELRYLKRIDLSANRIRVISGLKGLYNLEELNLSGNKIVSLANLSQIQGENYKLRHIDFSGNNLMDLKELPVLNHLKNMKSIIFHNNFEDSNPFCRIRVEYLRALSRLKCINNISVDGMSTEQIINEERGVITRSIEDDMDVDFYQD